MSRLLNEQLVAVRAASSAMPAGVSVGSTTIARWHSAGIRGNRLETVLIGGRRHTSREAILRFLNSQNQLAETPGKMQGSEVADNGAV